MLFLRQLESIAASFLFSDLKTLVFFILKIVFASNYDHPLILVQEHDLGDENISDFVKALKAGEIQDS